MEAIDLQIPVTCSGWLRKRRAKSSNWKERFFVLRGPNLLYYLKPTDAEPKGVFNLTSACKISEIRPDNIKKKKQQFAFRISMPGDDEDDIKDDVPEVSDKKSGLLRSRSIRGKETKDASRTLTKPNAPTTKEDKEKSGYVASLLGWFGSGETIAFANPVGERDKVVLFATDKYEDAEVWVKALEDQVRGLGSSQSVATGGSIPSSSVINVRKIPPPPDIKINEVEAKLKSNAWSVYSVVDGIRVFEYLGDDDGIKRSASSVNGPPCMRVNVSMPGSVNDVFMMIMSMPPGCRNGTIKSLRVVDTIDNCTDIVHITLGAVYVYPTWTVPRDMCLKRYWKQNFDGSHVICFDSVTHDDCPVVENCIRAEVHAAYVLSPPKIGDNEEESECMVTFMAYMDPKGWLWHEFGFQHNYLLQFMLHILDIRDASSTERFLQVHFNPSVEGKRGAKTDTAGEAQQGTLGTIPPSNIPSEMWSDIDASNFRIRGPTYLVDKVKATSAPNLFKLIAIDVFDVPEPTQHICSHPKNRVNLALQRGEKTWVFVMNIMVPGPPFLCFVAYMEGNPELFTQNTPFGRIANKFFNGNDDKFRDNRFKLIPKIIEGNMVIKMAVKDTPAILGNKLKQYYHKGENYFEIDIDVGSSSIARNVVGLAIGYSKAIVVDMGLCLQGDEENELPEVLMGGCSCIHLDCGKAKKI